MLQKSAMSGELLDERFDEGPQAINNQQNENL